MIMSSQVPYVCGVSRWASLMLSIWLMSTSAWSAETGYRLRPGDRIELKVVSLPELSQKALINVDGDVSVPLLGTLQVSGMTISDVQEKVRAVLPSKVFYRPTGDGKKVAYVANADDITVEIAEYRPVYVTGDVAKPGEQPYRPGMRVRHALALAGGYDIIRSRLGTDVLNVFEYQSMRDVLWLQYAQQQARYLRIEAELNGKSEIPAAKLTQRLPPAKGAATMAKFEADQLELRTADWEKEHRYLETSITQATKRAAVLAQQFEKELQASTADVEELERMKNLLGRGMTLQIRVADTRRAMLMSATRALQTGVQSAVAERERDKRERQLQRALDQRRLELTRDLQDAAMQLASIKSRIETNNGKLKVLGRATAQLAGGTIGNLELAVTREDGEGPKRIAATEDTLLAPGDVVEVTLRNEFDFGLPTEMK
jgi:polysaccharide biosynthesis/export protein